MARTLKRLVASLASVAALSVSAAATLGGVGRARADEPVRRDVRLYAADLVDEMVYDWLKAPPFPSATSLIVAEVNAPVGIGTRFAEDVENHLFDVLRANPKLALQLVHCSICRQKAVVSGPKRTTLSDALSVPETAEQLKRYPHLHALSLHFDVAPDGDLALWAEVYETAPPQRVAWARRYSTSTTSRAVLQEPSRLVGIAEARAEQKRLLEGRDVLQLVTRFPIRVFEGKESSTGASAPAPLIFIEQSVEASVAPRGERRAGLSVGVTSIKDSLQGWTVGAHFQQLLGRAEPSLTEPDLYLRLGVTYLRLEGPGAAPFASGQLDVARLVNDKDEPRASLTAFQLGLEAHVKYRFGFLAFVEHVPILENSLIRTQNLIVPVHSIGFAGVLRW